VRVPAKSIDSPSAGDLSPHLVVDLRRVPGIRKLAADYTYNFAALSAFFPGNPFDREAWPAAILRTRSKTRAAADIAAIVTAQQRRRGAPAAALESAARLADPGTVAVVTGQQAGLFGGPLFTLLKAITALKLAERISREHQVPAVPVFWIDAEDHDWDEVRSCTVFDETLATRTVALPPAREPEPRRVADRRLDESVVASLDELAAVLPATEFRPELLEALRAIYAPGASPADAFAQQLERTLGDRGLVVFDASDAAAKPIVRDIFVRELSAPGETGRRAALAGESLVAHGYHTQVHASPDTVALFLLDGARRPIKRSDQHLAVDGDPADKRAVETLVEQARTHPERFSPNVLLRPIVQDTLFPTVCYVSGPNELAYLAQLGGVYEHFGVPMPLVYPRATATIVDSAAMRFLTKYNLPFEAFQAQDEAALNELLASQMPASVEQAFQDASHAIDNGMSRLAQSVPALDPTLAGAARSTHGRMQHDLQALRGKMIQAAKRRDETLRRQFTRTKALTFPSGRPQEREIGFVSFLNQFGPVLAERLQEALPLEPGHWVITV
jgi:bacillithiol biosynthesis cysteine-adding enzyme BshC